MSNLTPFTFEGNQMRFVGECVVAADLAKALGYREAYDLTRTLDDDEKGPQIVRTPGGDQEMTVVTESGFYRACLNRQAGYIKDAGAREFVKRLQRWVTHEVLPSIRKRGMYATASTVEAMLADPDTAIRLLSELKQERAQRAELEAQAHADRPKVIFADAVAASKTSILIGDLAKMLRDNGIPTGGVRLFKWMRANGFLIARKGTDYNRPTQRAIELGVLEIKETVVVHSDGHTSISITPKVTGKGQGYFISRFLDGRFSVDGAA